MKTTPFSINFSAAQPRLEEQLHAQGLRLVLPAAARLQVQQDADEILRLRSRGLLTSREFTRALTRVLRTIQYKVKPL